MIKLRLNYRVGDYITANGQLPEKRIIADPTLDVCTDKDGNLCYIDIEICHDTRYYTDYITDVVNALISGEYGVEEFGWSGVSAAELFVLLLMKGYNLQECADWTNALPDKGERIKQYFKSE